MRNKMRVLSAAVVCGLLSAGTSFAQVTLPDTTANVAGHVSAAVTALGATVLAVMAGFFAFKVVRLGIRWASRIGG